VAELVKEDRMLSVSVAMATYNGQAHLKQQLESLAVQSYAPAELVVTDDGSSDDTLSVIAEFARLVPFPVHVHRNENRLGYKGNFMRAAGLCRSELIAFCDQDDVWYERKIEACAERFSEPDVLLVYHDADVVAGDGTRIDSLRQFAAPTSTIMPMSVNPMDAVPGFTQVFRRSIIQHSHLWASSQDHQFDGEPMAHDQWVYFLAAILGKIGYVSMPLAAYVQHGRNTFGHAKRVDPLQKLKSNFRNPIARISQTAAAASTRADILEAIEAKVEGPQAERAAAAAKHYRRLSMFNTTRKKIYASSAFTDRLSAFLKLLTCKAYGGTWNLSRTSLIKDICVGVPIGPRLA
jgi:hypothetical protein